MSRWRKSCLVACALVSGFAGSPPVRAQAVLHFGPGANTGLVCPASGTDAALGCGQHPNSLPTNRLDIFLNSAGASPATSVVLLLGVPVASVGSPPAMPSISRIDAYNPYVPVQDPSPGVYITGWSPSFCGWFGPGGANAYSVCGISESQASNSFVNWSAAANSLGLNPASFAIFQYALTGVEPLGPKGLYDIFFGSPLPVGTIEIAYGCAAGGTCYSTAFTEAGMVTGDAGQVIPEPGTLMLLAGGGLFLLGRARRNRPRTAGTGMA